MYKMTEFCQRVWELPKKDQELFFRYIVDTGIVTKEEADALRLTVSYNHLFCDKDFYEAVKSAVREQIIKEIFETR